MDGLSEKLNFFIHGTMQMPPFSVTNIYLSSQYTCSTTTTAGTTLTATGSVGYRAKLNGHNGFMTASHVLPVLGVTVKVNSKVCWVVKGVVHCNWGWGGQGNGYYLFNVFDMQYSDPHKTRATYNSNISAYVNIFPK